PFPFVLNHENESRIRLQPASHTLHVHQQVRSPGQIRASEAWQILYQIPWQEFCPEDAWGPKLLAPMYLNPAQQPSNILSLHPLFSRAGFLCNILQPIDDVLPSDWFAPYNPAFAHQSGSR